MATILPILLPLLTAVLLLLRPRPSRARRGWALASGGAQLVAAVYLTAEAAAERFPTMHLGGWAPPHGIVLSIDVLGGLMLVLSGITLVSSLLFSFAEAPPEREHPLRLPLLLFLVTGIHLAFITADLFNLYVAFEVMLLASYGLLTIEVNNRDVRHAFPYLALNIFGSGLFLLACGLAYALFGSLNFAHITARAPALAGEPALSALGFLFLAVFGLKAGLFPLYYWLPRSYPTLNASVAAFFSGMLTKVGVYVLLRIFGTVLPHSLTEVHTTLAWLSGLTMVCGVLGAVSRPGIRGILSWHILSQIGFMGLAIGLFALPAGGTWPTVFPIAACIFYIGHHIIVKASLFLIGGTVTRLNGSDDLTRTGNLWPVAPLLGICFLAQALSLAGLPPLSGFWGKLMIIQAGLALHEYVLIGLSLVASVLTLFSMLKIWNGAFWREDSAVPVHRNDPAVPRMIAVCGGMTLLSLAIGLNPQPLLNLATQAAEQATNQSAYVARILGQP